VCRFELDPSRVDFEVTELELAWGESSQALLPFRDLRLMSGALVTGDESSYNGKEKRSPTPDELLEAKGCVSSK